jgi:DNA-binding NtrC family response regulator
MLIVMTRPQPRVLIVDDEPGVLDALSRVLARHHFLPETARSLEEARTLLAAGAYDIVLTDLCLAESDGVEGLRVLDLVRDRWPATRVAMLTGYGSAETEAEARRRGARAFFRKSQSLSEIVQALDALMGAPPAAA